MEEDALDDEDTAKQYKDFMARFFNDVYAGKEDLFLKMFICL